MPRGYLRPPLRTPDPKQKVAVFVDGCFWHGCPKCSTSPKTNRAFWDRKRETNMARDKRVTRQLRRQGWKVIRIWQHSLKKSPNACLTRIRRALTRVGLAINMLRKTVGLLTPAPA